MVQNYFHHSYVDNVIHHDNTQFETASPTEDSELLGEQVIAQGAFIASASMVL